MLRKRCFDLLTHLHKPLKSFEEVGILCVGFQRQTRRLFFLYFLFSLV